MHPAGVAFRNTLHSGGGKGNGATPESPTVLDYNFACMRNGTAEHVQQWILILSGTSRALRAI